MRHLLVPRTRLYPGGHRFASGFKYSSGSPTTTSRFDVLITNLRLDYLVFLVMSTNKPCYVYCLECTNGNTYVGATVDLEKRLRQHNGELSGGATATTSQIKRGHSWVRACYVKNFPDWRSALQFEWRWKQLSRRERYQKSIDRRKVALSKLLAMDKATTAATPYAQWSAQPEVVWESQSDNLDVE